MAKRKPLKSTAKNGHSSLSKQELKQANQRLRKQVERLCRERAELKTELVPLKKSLIEWAKARFDANSHPETASQWRDFIATQKWHSLDALWGELAERAGEKP
jgi:hypothetical protein